MKIYISFLSQTILQLICEQLIFLKVQFSLTDHLAILVSGGGRNSKEYYGAHIRLRILLLFSKQKKNKENFQQQKKINKRRKFSFKMPFEKKENKSC